MPQAPFALSLWRLQRQCLRTFSAPDALRVYLLAYPDAFSVPPPCSERLLRSLHPVASQPPLCCQTASWINCGPYPPLGYIITQRPVTATWIYCAVT